MRFLFVHDRFGAFAGAEANAFNTAAALAGRGHELGLLHGPGTGLSEDAWREIFPSRFELNGSSAETAAAEAVSRHDPDIIYVHNLASPAVLRALLDSGLPVVRMVHDHQLHCLRGCKYGPFSRRTCTRALSPYCVFPCMGFLARDRRGFFPFHWISYRERHADLLLHRRCARLIVASGYMAEELARNGVDRGRIEIHPPVPPPAGDPVEPSFGSRNLIVYAGQIARGKGVDVLLESLARVETRFEAAILGDGHHRAHCEELSRRLGLADRVRFHGHVPQSGIAAFYREASVAVLSSIWPEPFGAVGLEAMRHGLPVVAFDAGAIREWLHDGENGYLVPWMDRDGFASRIDSLLADKNLARTLGARGRELAGREYGFTEYIDQLEQFFLRVTTGQPAELTS